MSMQEIIAQRMETIYQSGLDKQAQGQALTLELDESKQQLEAVEAEAKKLFDGAQAAADAVAKQRDAIEQSRQYELGSLTGLDKTDGKLKTRKQLEEEIKNLQKRLSEVVL